MDLFLRDRIKNAEITWPDLVTALNDSTRFNPYCRAHSYFQIFKDLFLSLILDNEIILLDSDFSENELVNLTGYTTFEKFDKQIKVPAIHSKRELIHLVFSNKKNWRLSLFTSGTTGHPKKISHDFKSITRLVKMSEKREENVWGLAYNPTHMAGVQVFFQAAMNGCSIVRLFGLSQDEVLEEIENYQVSHISSTPTFYRLLLPVHKKIESVKRLTSGGEKFKKGVLNELKNVFPNAKISNIYASTEAGALLESYGDTFEVKAVLEKYLRVKDNELLIHNSLIGFREKSEGWYSTGDLVEIVANNPLKFRFVSRKSSLINVGGYNVNPHEVEGIIEEIPGVSAARVYAKENSVLGNIICSEVVLKKKNLNEKEIRSTLQSKLQEYKIPRMINFVDKITTTRTGKISRIN